MGKEQGAGSKGAREQGAGKVKGNVKRQSDFLDTDLDISGLNFEDNGLLI